MNWCDDALRVAALRLLLCGKVKRTDVADAFLRQLDDIGIVVPSRQKDLFCLAPDRTQDFKEYLFARWPGYAVAAEAFSEQTDTITVAQLRGLRRVHLKSPDGFARLNRKTWSAWAGAHSKSGEAGQPDDLDLTVDDTLRVRVNDGLRLRSMDGHEIDLGVWQTMMGESIFSERAFAENWTLCGTMPDQIVTVENLGAFVDIKKPPKCLIVHTPGWNTTLTMRLIERLPASISWWHFGDIDPNGLKMGLLMGGKNAGSRKPRVWIPRATQALLKSHSLRLDKPWPVSDLPLSLTANESVAWLVREQRWMEHEAVVLQPDFAQELKELKELACPGAP